ncbi:unnamed protein product [Dicrocoelium dendriticum]|nr:unnamed protein product [Dicrocoelium dendriticum]
MKIPSPFSLNKSTHFSPQIFSFSQSNSSQNLILIIGGAHWLTNSMLKELSAVLKGPKAKRPKWKSISVIIKDHSAGFHSPITGVPYLIWHRRQRLTAENDALIKSAESYGWKVLRTYRLTWSRLEHFEAYAPCSCHFHQVKRLPSSTGGYTVHGPINDVMRQQLIRALLHH